MEFAVFVSVVVLLVFSVKSSCYHIKENTLYKLDPTWPIDSQAFKGPVYSAAIDDDNGEVYVSQV